MGFVNHPFPRRAITIDRYLGLTLKLALATWILYQIFTLNVYMDEVGSSRNALIYRTQFKSPGAKSDFRPSN